MHSAIETYEQAIEFLYGRINYERLNSDLYSADDFKLDRMAHLLERIGIRTNSCPWSTSPAARARDPPRR